MSYFDLFRGYGIHELSINYNNIVLLYIVAKASFFHIVAIYFLLNTIYLF